MTNPRAIRARDYGARREREAVARMAREDALRIVAECDATQASMDALRADDLIAEDDYRIAVDALARKRAEGEWAL